MEFRLLGPVEAYHEGRQVDLGRRRERCLLAILLLEVNRPVPVDRLIGLLWDGRPPASARAALHTHMSRLRGRLDPGGTGRYGIRLLTQGSGYTAVARPDTVDAHRFRSLVAAARELADPGARVATLDAALALWRGP